MSVFGPLRPRRTAFRRRVALTAALVLLAALFGTGSASAQQQQDQAVVVVHVAGDRGPTGLEEPLAGVTLRLFSSQNTQTPYSGDWAQCTSQSDGTCTFNIPIGTGGLPAGSTPWIGQLEGDHPPGWFDNTVLRTGGPSAPPSTEQAYRFQVTPGLQAGAHRDSLADNFMTGTQPSAYNRSSGHWQVSRENPQLPSQCGMNVALAMDLSSSVTPGDLQALKSTADAVTDSLVGTPSRMSAFSFSTNSPAVNGTNVPALQSVASQDEADAFKASYAGWQANGYTNWDQGLHRVAESMPQGEATHYDLVVMITDGNPTNFRDQGGSSPVRNRVIDVEHGIFSANGLKAQGSKILVAGVGDSIDAATEHNLQSLSGREPFDPDQGNIQTADYMRATQYEEVGEALHRLVEQMCAGTLSVTKYEVPAENEGEDITGAVPAGTGWDFGAEVLEPDGVTVDPTSGTTDDTSTVNFDLAFPPESDEALLRVTETQQDGWELVTQDGHAATCLIRDNEGDRDLHVLEDSATDPDPWFEVEVPENQAVDCQIYNKPRLAELTVDKQWDIDGDEFTHDDRPDGFDASLEFDGPGGDPGDLTPQDWGVPRPGYNLDDTAEGAEDVEVPDGCVLDEVRMARGDDPDNPVEVDPGALDLDVYAQSSEYMVTNVVSCDTRLTLVKTVDNSGGGTASPEDWTLSADGPDSLSGTTGSDDVTEVIVQPGDYDLAESDGPGSYEREGWSCVGESGEELADGDSVPVAMGDRVTCTVNNVFQEPGPTPSPTPSPSPTPTPDPTPTTDPEPPGDGPETGSAPSGQPGLPVTGASVAGLAGAAVLLVLGGLMALVLVRRKRTGSGA